MISDSALYDVQKISFPLTNWIYSFLNDYKQINIYITGRQGMARSSRGPGYAGTYGKGNTCCGIMNYIYFHLYIELTYD